MFEIIEKYIFDEWKFDELKMNLMTWKSCKIIGNDWKWLETIWNDEKIIENSEYMNKLSNHYDNDESDKHI